MLLFLNTYYVYMFPLRQHVQNNSKGINESLIQEISETLENMEDFTLKLLMDIVDDMAEVAVQHNH